MTATSTGSSLDVNSGIYTLNGVTVTGGTVASTGKICGISSYNTPSAYIKGGTLDLTGETLALKTAQTDIAGTGWDNTAGTGTGTAIAAGSEYNSAAGETVFKRIKFPAETNNVTTIGSRAFFKYKKLKKVTINGNCVKTIGKKAFKNTKSGIKITIKAKNKETATKLFNKIIKTGGAKKATLEYTKYKK